MEKEKLPNSTIVLLFGIFSIPLCCCWGLGVALGIVALYLAKKDMTLYQSAPDKYRGEMNIKIGQAFAIIGITLGALFLIFAIYLNVNYTDQELLDMQANLMEKLKHQQEME